MVETLTGTAASGGTPYDELLDRDSRPVRPILRAASPLPPGPTRVAASRYYSREFHNLEVERLWKRVWQMACHEDDIPDVGDYFVYNVASLSFLIVRTGPDEFRAFWNVCLHRGRLLRETGGKHARDFRCAFHGWNWTLEGKLKEVPCHWDFPTVTSDTHDLPQTKLGRWGGFIFINPDLEAGSLEEHLGTLSEHYTLLPFERRYKQVHVAKVLRCNWKVAQEAFMEAYHVVATHPTILENIGDANSKYDVFGNFSRAISPNSVVSPHVNPDMLSRQLPDGRAFTKLRHAISGAQYERLEQGHVLVTAPDGRTGMFNDQGEWLSGVLTHADQHMCNWIGGRQLPDADAIPSPVVDHSEDRRAAAGARARDQLRPLLGEEVETFSDAELIDSIYFSVFPNFGPWGSFNPIVYRFRPYGDDPDQCIHECMFFAPVPKGEARPPAAPITWLGPDDDYVDAPQLGLLAKVFNQDVLNMPRVQQGLKAMRDGHVIFGNYGETKIRHFHGLLDQWVAD